MEFSTDITASTTAGRADLRAAGPIAVLELGTAWMGTAIGWRQAALLVVGAAAGVVLYHAAFGFTSAWRVLISDRRGAGVRAQMLMLAATCLVFFPVLASGSFFGQPVRGSIASPGLAVVAGAFIFGVGMQLGGGCASGTLYSAGGGSTRMLLVLAAFMGISYLANRWAMSDVSDTTQYLGLAVYVTRK